MWEGTVVNATVVSDCFTTHSQQFYEVSVTDVDINLKDKQINKTKKEKKKPYIISQHILTIF